MFGFEHTMFAKLFGVKAKGKFNGSFLQKIVTYATSNIV